MAFLDGGGGVDLGYGGWGEGWKGERVVGVVGSAREGKRERKKEKRRERERRKEDDEKERKIL